MACSFECYAENKNVNLLNDVGRKEWFYIFRVSASDENKMVKMCILEEKIEKSLIFDTCEGSNTFYDKSIYLIIDLNNDGIEDMILNDYTGKYYWGLGEFTILLGTQDGSYITVRKFLLTSSLTPTKEVKNGFRVLKSHAICGDTFGMEFGVAEAKVVFDPKSLTYKTVGVNEDDELDGTVCSLNKEAIKAFETYYKQKYGDEDSESTEEPEQTSPSFNCAKASTQVEKTICGDTELTKADKQLSDEFRKLNSTLKDAHKEKLLTEQKAWLKQRNLCNNARCLLESYISRIQDIQGNYKEQAE
jgi:uncharacterized protein YecT (DUF1311 family)